MNLLLLEPGERSLPKNDPRANHIRKVLRLGEGDRLRAGEIGGAIGTAVVGSIDATGVHIAFDPEGDPAPLAPVELILGHPRPIVLRRMLRDLTALGLSRIAIVPTVLGEKSYREANLWDDVRTPMLEGAAQGGTTLLPQLVHAARLADAIATAGGDGANRFVLHIPDDLASTDTLFGLLAGVPRTSWVTIAIGSERGWTDAEVSAFTDAGFHCASLGTRTLRTETAAAVAVWAAIAATAEPAASMRSHAQSRESRGGTR